VRGIKIVQQEKMQHKQIWVESYQMSLGNCSNVIGKNSYLEDAMLCVPGVHSYMCQ